MLVTMKADRIIRMLSEDQTQTKLSDFQIPFEFKAAEPEQVLTDEEKVKLAKSIWKARIHGVPQ